MRGMGGLQRAVSDAKRPGPTVANGLPPRPGSYTMQAVLLFRAVLSSVFVAIVTIVGALLALAVRLFDASSDRVLDLARLWSRSILGFSGIQVTVDWRTDLQPGQPYVFMANHLSTVDIWALFVALPLPLRMIAKKQLGAIPIFGWGMRAGRFIFIDRTNAVAARRSIDEAKRRIRGGESVLLFPEGTRSRDGRLGPFKKGGFHLAIDAGVPIIPLALSGTRQSMPPGSLLLRPGQVRVSVGAPIATEGMTGGDRNQLLERVRQVIAGMLDEHQAGDGGSPHVPSPRAAGKKKRGTGGTGGTG
jgi:1-acyl-sn-glycerol-3-phosphate acyltransferase